MVGVRLWVSFHKCSPNWTLEGDLSSQPNSNQRNITDLTQEDGWKTKNGKITKKYRARPGMHSHARYFIVMPPSWVFQPSCCVRSLLMQTQPLTRKFQTVGFSLWLNGTLMEIRGPFVESPEGFRANFGWQFSLYLQNRGVSKHETLSYFNFYSLYNVERPAIQNKQVRVYTNGFSDRKVFGTFEKRATACIQLHDFWT